MKKEIAEERTIVPFERSYWVIPGRLAAGYYPGDLHPDEAGKKLRGLIDAGIRHVINLMEEDEVNMHGNPFIPYREQLQEMARKAGATVGLVRIPVRDYGIPSVSYMCAILDEIDASVARNKPVYVHCLGGKGRTGTVVGCYLMRHGIATDRNVLDMIRYLRRNLPEAHHPSPESDAQRKMVIHWGQGE